jgi:hypothetical protein
VGERIAIFMTLCALVTGSGRGLGRTVAELLARRGATVAVNSFHSRDMGERTAAEIERLGGKATHLWGSIANAEHVDRMFDEIDQRFGGLDLLVCNASDGRIGSFLEMTSEDCGRALRTYCRPRAGQRPEDPPANVVLSGPFDCLRDIEVGEYGRRAIFIPPREHANCLGDALPALLFDAAWRLSVMHAGGPGAVLHVPVRVGWVTVARRREPDIEPLIIRASAPEINGEEVKSACTEVTDRLGRLRLRVEDSVARRVV